MKKSKVIIPALGMLALSTAASVTGTVAWFTASRTVSFDVTNVSVTNPEGSMTVAFSAGTATEVVGTNAGIAFKANTKLRDASVNFGTNNALEVYKSHLDGTGTAIDGYTKLSNNAATYMENVFYVATWSASFTINGDASLKYAIFFDAVTSKLATINPDNNIHNALRIAMYTSETDVVWAPRRASETVKHVKAAAAAGSTSAQLEAAQGEFVNTHISSTSYNNQYLSVNDTTYNSLATAKTDAKYIGLASGGAAITVNFVLWYEGLDPDCLSSVLGTKESSSISATLGFNCIDTTSWSA